MLEQRSIRRCFARVSQLYELAGPVGERTCLAYTDRFESHTINEIQ